MAGLDLSRVMAKIDGIAEGFGDKEAQIGFFPGAQYQSPQGSVPVAYVAAIHEFGCPEENIPARGFMRLTVEDKQKDWAAEMAEYARGVMQGKLAVDGLFDYIGAAAVGDMVETIQKAPGWDPLAKSTLAQRDRKGQGHAPLQASGMLIASINHLTVDKS